jgi:hypothetical protein
VTTRGWRSGIQAAALLGLCAVLPAVEVPKDEPYRTWTSARGKTIEAKLIGLSEGKAQFRLKTGKSLVIKRDYLATDDQEYLTHVGEPDAPARKLSRQTLDMIVLRDVEFQDEPFEDVLGFIEQASKSPGLAPDGIRTGVHQDVDLNAIPGMTLRAEQLTLEQLLSAISDKTGLKYRLIKNTLVFTGADYAGELVTRTYQLRDGALGLDDSTGNARDQVLRLLGDQGITFPRGADVKYEVSSRKLLVTNTPENIRKTDRLLARMVVANARADMALSVYRLSERRAAALRGFMSIQPGLGGRVQADDEMDLAVAAFRRDGVPSAMCRFQPSVVAGRRFAESKSQVSFSGVPLIHPGGKRMSLTFGLDIRSGDRSVTASGTAELEVGQTIIVLAHSGLASAGDAGGKPEYYVCEMTLKGIAEK